MSGRQQRVMVQPIVCQILVFGDTEFNSVLEYHLQKPAAGQLRCSIKQITTFADGFAPLEDEDCDLAV